MWLATHAPAAEPVLRSSSLSAQLVAVQRGLGVALMPQVFATSHGLRVLPLAPKLRKEAETFPIDELWLAASRSRRTLPRVAAVWEFLLELSRELPT